MNKMPTLFIGHGSPMNAIETNQFSLGWKNITSTFPKPKAILCISAHWETAGSSITAMQKPKTIHDFGGFPQELFNVEYNANGNPKLALEIQKMVTKTKIKLDENWGLDHGTWSILNQMYPQANIPVLQLSLDYTKDAKYHFELAKQLQFLRGEGVLIIGSGNIVHNFEYLEFRHGFNTSFAHAWADKANNYILELVKTNNFEPLINYQESPNLRLAAPTPEHFLPLLYTLGVKKQSDKVEIFNNQIVGGAFSMACLKIG